jgi:probable F420-dependent oxidoreductase
VTKLGVNIPNFGPTATPSEMLGWARFAEENGLAVAMMSDHVAPTPDVVAQYPAPFYDAFTTLSWLGGLTDRLELGTTVAVLPYRHPLLTARMAANIDQFTKGRFILGVGVGWSEAEFTALGLPFRERGRITDEYLHAIKEAWTNDEVTLDGDYVTYQEVNTGPRSARVPHPPLWIGGSSRRAIRRAAHFGDAWHPINPEFDWLRDTGLPALREAAETIGHPMPAFCPRIRFRPTDRDLPPGRRRIGIGSITQIHDDLVQLEELDAKCVILDTNPDRPSDRRPSADDWRALTAIANRNEPDARAGKGLTA